MSGCDNPLIMRMKLAGAFAPGDPVVHRRHETWGKIHIELRACTQFVRFSYIQRPCSLTINNMQVDEKEPKMQTKGQVRKLHLDSRRL